MDYSEVYESAPLEDSTTQIRLLRGTRLSQGTAGGDQSNLSYNIITCKISEAPEYDAISYTWGDACERRVINVNGFPFSVTINCYYSLLRARAGGSTLTWIDSICINQQHLQEKSNQVARMWDIFRTAARVLVWFGFPDGVSDRVYAAARDIQRITANVEDVNKRDKRVTRAYDEGQLVPQMNPYLEYLSNQAGLGLDISMALCAWLNDRGAEYCRSLCAAYNSLGESMYFQRLWIVQELHAGQSRVHFMFRGGLVSRLIMHYMKLVLDIAFEEAPDYGVPFFAPNVGLTPSTDIWQSYALTPEGGSSTFEFFRSLRHRECHDPRDRLYATLHLLDWESTGVAPLQPDYSKSAFDVAKSIVMLSNSLSLDFDQFADIVKSLGVTLHDPALEPLLYHSGDGDRQPTRKPVLSCHVGMNFVCRLSRIDRHDQKYAQTYIPNFTQCTSTKSWRGGYQHAYGFSHVDGLPEWLSVSVPKLARVGDFIIERGFSLVMRMDSTCTKASIIGRAGDIYEAEDDWSRPTDLEPLETPPWHTAYVKIDTSPEEAIGLVAPLETGCLGGELCAFRPPKVVKLSLKGEDGDVIHRNVSIVDMEELDKICPQSDLSPSQSEKSPSKLQICEDLIQ